MDLNLNEFKEIGITGLIRCLILNVASVAKVNTDKVISALGVSLPQAFTHR